MPLPKHKKYTIDDIFALPEGKRAELIDGQIYNVAPPSPFHQKLVMELSATIRNYIKKNGGPCEVYPAPFAVFLNQDAHNYVDLIFPLSAILPTWMPVVIRVPPILLLKSYHQAVNAWII